jgi:hypothetical protein
MKTFTTIGTVLLAGFALSGCGSLDRDMDEARKNTKEIGLLIQSVQKSTANFQKQRDTLAVATKVQRDNLELIAMQQEGDAYRAAATWNVAGQADRKHTFDALKEESGSLLTRIEAKHAREVAQDAEVRATRSAVSFQSAKLNEAAIALVELGESRTAKEKIGFYYVYMKEVRDVIKADSEAAAKKQADSAKELNEKEKDKK